MSREPTDASPQELLAHAEWVRKLAAAIVRADEADDVAQQAFAQALAARRPTRNLRAWFAAIVRNVARRRRRDETTRAKYEAFATAALESGDPALAVARAELHRRVVDAVLALAEPYRSTLVLRFFDEKPAEEIARAQSLPLETVRTRVKRGLAQLRARLDESGGKSDGATLQRSLALLLLPGSRVASVTGALGMGATSKGALAAAGVVVLAAFAWRWVAPSERASPRHDVEAPVLAAAAVPDADPLAWRPNPPSSRSKGASSTRAATRSPARACCWCRGIGRSARASPTRARRSSKTETRSNRVTSARRIRRATARSASTASIHTDDSAWSPSTSSSASAQSRRRRTRRRSRSSSRSSRWWS